MKQGATDRKIQQPLSKFAISLTNKQNRIALLKIILNLIQQFIIDKILIVYGQQITKFSVSIKNYVLSGAMFSVICRSSGKNGSEPLAGRSITSVISRNLRVHSAKIQ